MSDEEQGFKVQDKRRFDESGESRDGIESEADSAADPPKASDQQRSADTGSSETTVNRDQPAGPNDANDASASGLRDMNFSSFVVGLATQALSHLGVAPDPATGVVHQDLVQAQAMIDILAMLQEKTAGNLTDDEDRMMEELLYELRMLYVGKLKGDGGAV